MKDDDKSRKTVESECIGSEEEEEEGYNSDRGYGLLSKMWSREEREKQNRNKGREMERADEALSGNKDNIEGKIEKSADEINDSPLLLQTENMLGDNKMWAVRQRQQGVILLEEKR